MLMNLSINCTFHLLKCLPRQGDYSEVEEMTSRQAPIFEVAEDPISCCRHAAR